MTDIVAENEPDQSSPKHEAARFTSSIMHKHYCENDCDAVKSALDEEGCFSWIGIGEEEYALGGRAASRILDSCRGKVPPCVISDEHYHVIEPAPGIFVCTGSLWIETDERSNAFARVHQRVTCGVRQVNGRLRCFHLHTSLPYDGMAPDEVGFPTRMAERSFEYLQEKVSEQTRMIDAQAAELSSIYDTIPCAIMRFQRTADGYRPLIFNPASAEMIGMSVDQIGELDWSGGFCGLMVEEDASRMSEQLARLAEPGDQFEMTCRLKLPSGKILHFSSINEIVSLNDRGAVLQKIAFDVSRRVELERMLEKKSYEDALTNLYNRNKFNQELADERYGSLERLGVAYFDINGLKRTNDEQGHRAGDDLISRTAGHITDRFPGKAYRIGGDEFVIIDADLSRDEFDAATQAVLESMNADDISIALGVSFRDGSCNLEEQFEEADRLMYEDKARHYSQPGANRRKR